MTAAKDAIRSDNPATSPAVALRVAVFDNLTAVLAAAGTSCTNGYVSCPYCSPTRAGRYRTRQYEPSMGVAMRMAEILHTTVDHLFEQVAS